MHPARTQVRRRKQAEKGFHRFFKKAGLGAEEDEVKTVSVRGSLRVQALPTPDAAALGPRASTSMQYRLSAVKVSCFVLYAGGYVDRKH
jgi:hypothetical protein